MFTLTSHVHFGCTHAHFSRECPHDVHFAAAAVFWNRCFSSQLAQLYDSMSEWVEPLDEADAAENGGFPDNVAPAARQLYEKINRRYGFKDPRGAHWHGVWSSLRTNPMSMTYLCIEGEDERRGLPAGKVDKLADHSDACTAEYRRDGKLVATLLGSGEKLGPWEAYTYFDAEADGPSVDLEVGYNVSFGPDFEAGTVARILRADEKPAEKAAGSASKKPQQRFLVLVLADGYRWKHISLQCIHYGDVHFFGRTDMWNGCTAETLETALRDDFQPKSVSAATKEAAKYALSAKASHSRGAAARGGARGGARGSARGRAGRTTGGSRGKRTRAESEEEDEEEGGEEEESEESSSSPSEEEDAE
jgi:hypothetical protein